MPAFQTSIDIANRACQHVGARRITAFTDDTKQASEISFCYDKLREAELERNVWGFAVRRAALRPVDSTTTILAPAAWAAGTFNRGQVVSYLGSWWECMAQTTTGTPGQDGSGWDLYCGPKTIRAFVTNTGGTASDVPYYSGELVLQGGIVYRSLITGNSDIPPSSNWLSLGAVSTTISILYPIGSGPAEDEDTRNIFMKPAAYLRTAPQDPKSGNISWLGAPHGQTADDWTYNDDMIVSATTDLIVLRFVASVTDVRKMHPMFCEGLGARVGIEICEPVTQSAEKLQSIGSMYKSFMGEARLVNAIEQGPTETYEDDWIACRI